MRSLFLTIILLFLTNPAFGQEVEGVTFPDQITSAGKTLHLNGVGVRSKFIFDIYVAGLYLEKPSHDATTVVADNSQKQIQMHFLYKEVSAAKLIKGWNSGFEKNLSKDELKTLETHIESFNAFFTTIIHDGDNILITYMPNTGTTVAINGTERGVVKGKNFNDALLKIWLGNKPVTGNLKSDLLGLNK